MPPNQSRPPRANRSALATILVALALAPPLAAGADGAVLLLDVSEPGNVDPDLLEDLADQLVYFADLDVIDAQCVRAAERAARRDDAGLRREIEDRLAAAEAAYQDFDPEGAAAALTEAADRMATLDPLAHGPLLARLCRLGVLLAIDRGDPAGVEDHLQCLVSVQPWFQPTPGLFDPDTEAQLERLRGELSRGASTLAWDDLGDDVTVVVDGFTVTRADEVLLVPGIHLVQTTRDGFVPVRRRVHVQEEEAAFRLPPPSVPSWDDAARKRLRELLDDEEPADRDPAVRGLMASCEADHVLLLSTRWEDDLRTTGVGLVRARGKTWEYLGRFDTHLVPVRVSAALGPQQDDARPPRVHPPVVGTFGWAFGAAFRTRAPADQRMYAGFGFGVGLHGGLRIKGHLHVGVAGTFSLMGTAWLRADDDDLALVFQESLAWVDLGGEAGVVFTPGRASITLVAGGGPTFVNLAVNAFIITLDAVPAQGGWIGARFALELPTASAVRVGPSLQLHHAFVPFSAGYMGIGSNQDVEWLVEFQSLTQLQVLLSFTF